jgi:hypothetical protein
MGACRDEPLPPVAAVAREGRLAVLGADMDPDGLVDLVASRGLELLGPFSLAEHGAPTVCAWRRLAPGQPGSISRQASDRQLSAAQAASVAKRVVALGLRYDCRASDALAAQTYLNVVVGPVRRWPGDSDFQVDLLLSDSPWLLGCVLPRTYSCSAARSNGRWTLGVCSEQVG